MENELDRSYNSAISNPHSVSEELQEFHVIPESNRRITITIPEEGIKENI